MSKVIREVIIMLLICLAIMVLLAVGLYQWIPNRKIIPQIEVYAISDEVKDLLEDDIQERTEENGNPILTYTSSNESIEVTSSDLNSYEESYDYVPGKSHPFAEVIQSVKPEGEGNPDITVPDETGDTEGEQGETEKSRVESTEPSAYSGANGSK